MKLEKIYIPPLRYGVMGGNKPAMCRVTCFTTSRMPPGCRAVFEVREIEDGTLDMDVKLTYCIVLLPEIEGSLFSWEFAVEPGRLYYFRRDRTMLDDVGIGETPTMNCAQYIET